MNELHLSELLAAALVLNLIAGAWRSTQRPRSWRWFLAIHVPIPFVFVLRRTMGIGWTWIPVVVVFAVAGQLLGAWLFSRWQAGRAQALVVPVAQADDAGGA
jgi:hypothetical protein